MSLKCGIVGLPNVGKSTLFNALTKAGIAAANFPFCTIDPNIGVVPVPDPRLQALAAIAKPLKVIPTSIGPKWSKKTNGPTARRAAAGSRRRTIRPPPRSRDCGARVCNWVTNRPGEPGPTQCRRRLKSHVALRPGFPLSPP